MLIAAYCHAAKPLLRCDLDRLAAACFFVPYERVRQRIGGHGKIWIVALVRSAELWPYGPSHPSGHSVCREFGPRRDVEVQHSLTGGQRST